MRWKVRLQEVIPPPKIGDKRTIFRFLIFPLTLPVENGLEKRWLEIVEIEQEWQKNGICLSDGGGYDTYGWIDKRFMID